MGTLFEDRADQHAATVTHLDRPFDIAPERGVEYDVTGLAELVCDASGWLVAAGARPGDRVAIVKDNHWDYDLLACAAIRVGALPALISGHLPPAALELLLKRLDPTVLVTTSAILRAAAESGTDLTGLVRRTISLTPGESDVDGVIGLAELRGAPVPAPHRRPDDDPLVVTHTSGTTGVPKLVAHSTTTIIRRLAGMESIRWPVLGTRRSDTVASVSSFAHGRTFCWTASVFCLAPREILIVSDIGAECPPDVLRVHRPTILEALPAAFTRWQPAAGEPASPFTDTRMFVSTYDAVHPPVVRSFLAASRRRFPIWMQGWGQTETGPLSFRFLTRRSVASAAVRHPTTRDLGRPMPTRTRLAVVDPRTLRPIGRGRPGLVMASTAARCLDYVGESDRWAEKAVGRWWNTGDLGVLTRSGRVRLLDREIDRVPGTSCLELEDVIEDRLPGVVECVVLGVRGRPPLPVLVTADGRFDGIGGPAWQHAVRDLPELADPVTLRWQDVPRTGTGKVRRVDLLHAVAGDAETHGTGLWA
jgi:acyl-coenzyme A synthetase/AMP-(fatty) acid ligase